MVIDKPRLPGVFTLGAVFAQLHIAPGGRADHARHLGLNIPSHPESTTREGNSQCATRGHEHRPPTLLSPG